MISSSSDDSDDNDADERCFQRELLNAIERNNYDELRRLLNNDQYNIKSIINSRDGNNKNNTLLHAALKKRKHRMHANDNWNIINLLITKGANINVSNDLGETPYHIVNKRLKTGSQSGDWISLKALFLPNQASCSSENPSGNQHLSQDASNKISSTIIPDDMELPMDSDESSAEKKPTYQASGLKYSLHGVVYQLQLLMLFLHRATVAYDSFYLATEMDEAEKFDDVVLKYKNSNSDSVWTWRFLQAKHLSNVSANRIQKSQLFSLNEKLPFSLHKYFSSFCKIRHNRFFTNSVFQDFIICTNAEIDQNAVMYFTEDKSLKNDKILFFKSFSFKTFRLHQNTKMRLIRNYESKFQYSPDIRHLNEFLDKFKFVTNFPNEYQLNRLIIGELGNKYGLLNAELATNTFKSHVLKWLMSYKQGKSEYLLISDGKRFLKLIEQQIRTFMTSGLSIAYPEKLFNYGISFRNIPGYIQKFMYNKNIQILHLESKSTLLTSIKIAKSLKYIDQYKIRDSFIFITVKQLLMRNIRNLISDSFSSTTSHHLLIINFDANEKLLKGSLTKFYLHLFEILSSCPLKKLIIIGSRRNCHIKKITDLGTDFNFTQIKDTNTYKDLDEKSQEYILNKQISFQGQHIPLHKLLNTFSAHKVLDETILLMLLKNKDIIISSSNTQPFLINDRLYLPRTLSRKTVDVEILQNNNFISSNTIFITGLSENGLVDLGVEKDKLYVFKNTENYQNGIILPSENATKETNFQIFKKFCNNDDKNVYWLEYKDNKFLWENFSGDNINLKEFVDKNTCQEYIKEEDLVQINNYIKKIYIIEGEPGIGKSFFTINLINILKKINPFQWILRINLNDHSGGGYKVVGRKTLEDIKFSANETEKAVNFLLEIVIPENSNQIETHFQRTFLKLALQSSSKDYKYPNVVIIFDGFDEISPTYKENTLNLLNALRKSNIFQLWITTRSHETLSLEQELKSPAYKLNSFNKQQKIDYVTTIFQGDSKLYSFLDNDNILNSLCKYLEDIKINFSDQGKVTNSFHYNWDIRQQCVQNRLEVALNTEFTNNPLHLRMIAELMSKNKMDLSHNINLLGLYCEFVNTKFNIYYDEKTFFNGSVAANEMRKRDLNILRKIHQNFAIKELFSELSEEENMEIANNELVRVGFLVLYHSSIRFVHRSFAEYFFADYLEENFENPNVQNALAKSVLNKSNFRVVRKFLNKSTYFLSQLRDSKNNVVTTMGEDHSLNLLYAAIEEDNENIVKSYLENIKLNNCSIIQRVRTELRYTSEIHRKMLVMLNVLDYDIDVFSLLLNDIMTDRNSFQRTCRDGSCLHAWAIYYSGRNSLPLLDRIFEVAFRNEKFKENNEENKLKVISKLSREECLAQASILHILGARGRFDLITDFILWLQQKIINKENILNGLLLVENCRKQTFLHTSTYDSTLNSFLTFLFQNFTNDILKNLILHGDFRGQTILHYYVATTLKCCTSMNSFLNTFKLNFDKDTITEIIFKIDYDGKTALHCVTTAGKDNECLKQLINFIICHFEQQTIIKLLLLRDYDGKSILHNAASYHIALNQLLEFCKNNLNIELLQTVLFSIDIYEQTLLHAAVQHFNTGESLIALLDCINSYFGESTLENFICQTDYYGRTILHLTCCNSDETLEKLLHYIWTNFSIESAKTIIFQSDINGLTALHCAVQNFTRNTIITLLNFVKAKLGVSVLTQLILACDLKGQTVLHAGAQEKISFKPLNEFMAFLNENCDVEIIFRGLLIKKDNRGKTPIDVIRQKQYFQPIYIWLINKLEKSNRVFGEIGKNIIFTRAEINILWYQIATVFFKDENKEAQLNQILDQYLQEYPVKN